MPPQIRPYLRAASVLLAASAFLAACTTSPGKRSDDDDDTGSGGMEAAGGGSQEGGGGSGAGDPTVCERWNADRVNMNEAMWSGDLASCQPGDVDMEGRDRALRMVNLYRWLADLPAVEHEAERNAKAQACALLMHANGSLSHNPPMSWTCHSADGAEAAGKSNIATAPGVLAVDLYMVDPGNDTTLGHRRWILSNSAGPIGLGSTSEFSCMWVLGGSNNLDQQWTAFPPPGEVPLELIDPFGWATVDETGWSVQSDFIDLSGAQVTITDDGQDMPVTVTQLQGGYGSDDAISIIPQGWSSQAGHTYQVRVTGITPEIEYEVNVVDCGG